MAEALGFDYRKVTRENLAEVYDIACFIYKDAPSRQMLEEFVRTYISVQNPEELAEFSGAVAFEIVLSALLIVFTGGVGLVARAALSVRLLGLLKSLGEALRDLATFIVKATIKSAPRVKGMTGTGAVTVTIRRPKEITPSEILIPPYIEPSPTTGNKSAPASQKTVYRGENSGETESTAFGKLIHKTQASLRRESGLFDTVEKPIKDKDGNPILVPKRVDLKTGEALPGSPLQNVIPDAVSFDRALIVDDKPMGRPIAKDRQEIIRFINAYEKREGNLPEVIAIQRYDPKTGAPVKTDLYSPHDFLPKLSQGAQ